MPRPCSFALLFTLLCVLGQAQAAPGLVISEVQQGAPEFVELYNASQEPVDLTGHRLSGDVVFFFASGQRLNAGARLVLARSPRAFEQAHPGVPVGGVLPKRLRDKGGRVRLVAPGEVLVDEVRYGASRPGESLQRLTSAPTQGKQVWAHGEPTPSRPYAGDAKPPAVLLDRVLLEPRIPTSGAPVQVSVRALGAQGLQVLVSTRQGEQRVLLRPDPQDSTRYLGTLPARPALTLVRYAFEATGPKGEVVRLESDPWGEERLGYLVRDAKAPASTLPVYQLEVDPKLVKRMLESPERDRFPAVFASLEDDGSPRLRPVEIQCVGKATRRYPKRSWRVSFAGERFRGSSTLVLRTNHRDQLFVRELLAYRLYQRAGVATPPTRLVRVHLNGRFFGVYLELQPVDADWVARQGMPRASVFQGENDDDSNRCGARRYDERGGYETVWERKTHADEPLDELIAFIEGLYSPPDQLEAYFEEHLEVEAYLRYVAVTVLLTHFDSLLKNYFWCRDREGDGKWRVVPWDLDLTFGLGFTRGLYPKAPLFFGTQGHEVWADKRWNKLRDAVLSVPSFRRRYVLLVQELCEEAFTPEAIGTEAQELLKAHWQDVVDDRALWGELAYSARPVRFDPRRVEREVQLTVNHVRQRRAFLLAEAERELARLGAPAADPPAEDPLPAESVAAQPEVTRPLVLDLVLLGLLGAGVLVYFALGGARTAARQSML